MRRERFPLLLIERHGAKDEGPDVLAVGDGEPSGGDARQPRGLGGDCPHRLDDAGVGQWQPGVGHGGCRRGRGGGRRRSHGRAVQAGLAQERLQPGADRTGDRDVLGAVGLLACLVAGIHEADQPVADGERDGQQPGAPGLHEGRSERRVVLGIVEVCRHRAMAAHPVVQRCARLHLGRYRVASPEAVVRDQLERAAAPREVEGRLNRPELLHAAIEELLGATL